MNNDLISRSALLDALPKNDEIFSFEVRRVICNAPAVDAEPVRHGCEWCKGEYHTELSAHAVRYHTSDKSSVYVLDVNYCPNCGAKMDAEVEG